jgi:hypothetical protein
MTLNPKRSAVLCRLLGAWLALLTFSFFPLWTTVDEEIAPLM